jgi:hypothetical protein
VNLAGPSQAKWHGLKMTLAGWALDLKSQSQASKPRLWLEFYSYLFTFVPSWYYI